MTTPLAIALHSILALAVAAEPPYSVAEKPWKSTWGNHRARVTVATPADAVLVHLPWRRRDHDVADKAIFVIHRATQKRVMNATPIAISREAGTVIFQAAVAGEYHVYFMPFTIQGGAFPSTHYEKRKPSVNQGWLQRHKPDWQSLPTAALIDFQSRSEFHRRDPMELVATEAELKALLAEHWERPFLLFPEDRTQPIRMADDLPVSWIRRGPSNTFTAAAKQNEFFVFQIGVFTSNTAIADLQVEMEMGPLPIRCINTGGRDWLGRLFHKTVSVPAGEVQALWFGVDVPADQCPGMVEGTVKIARRGEPPETVAVSLAIEDALLKDRGDSELWRMSRIRWLDSTAGLDDTVTAPYTPLLLDGNTIRCLGRTLTTSATQRRQS